MCSARPMYSTGVLRRYRCVHFAGWGRGEGRSGALVLEKACVADVYM